MLRKIGLITRAIYLLKLDLVNISSYLSTVNIIVMKKCSGCLIVKSKEEFSKCTSSKDKLQSRCKSCKKRQADKWRQNNPDYLTNYWHNNQQAKEKQKITNKKYHTNLSGVYGLYENGKCLYIGESKWIRSRKNTHHHLFNHPEKAPGKSWKNFYNMLNQNHHHIIFGIIEETNNTKEREKYWITQLDPLYNKKST